MGSLEYIEICRIVRLEFFPLMAFFNPWPLTPLRYCIHVTIRLNKSAMEGGHGWRSPLLLLQVVGRLGQSEGIAADEPVEG